MASYIACIPRPSTSTTAESLCRAFTGRRIPCHAEFDGDVPVVVFEASSDVLYLTVVEGRIDYLEHSPHYSAKPLLAGHIGDVLLDVGFEFIDEEDPIWRAAE